MINTVQRKSIFNVNSRSKNESIPKIDIDKFKSISTQFENNQNLSVIMVWIQHNLSNQKISVVLPVK